MMPEKTDPALEAALAAVTEIVDRAVGAATGPLSLPLLGELAGQIAEACHAAGQAGLAGVADMLQWGAREAKGALGAEDLRHLCTWSLAMGESLGNGLQPERAGELVEHLLALSFMPELPPEIAEAIFAQLQADAEAESLPAVPALAGFDEPLAESFAGLPASPDPQEPTEDLDPSEAAWLVEADEADEADEVDAADRSSAWISTEELTLLRDALAEHLIPIAFQLARAVAPAEIRASVLEYRRQWSLIADAMRVLALVDLENAAAPIETTLTAVEISADNIDPLVLRALGKWPLVLSRYLQNPSDHERASELALFLAEGGLADPLARDLVEPLALGLAAQRVGVDPAQADSRTRVAFAADVELAIGADVLPSVLEGMLLELPGRATELSQRVQRFTKTGRFEDIDAARRIAHTLKGDGNIVGVRGIANLTHSLEEILVVLADAPGVPVADLGETLIEAADCLEAMSDYVLGRGAPPANAVSTLQRVLDWDNALQDDPPAQAIAAPPLESAEPPPLAAVEDAPLPQGAVAATVNIPVATLDLLLRLAGEAIITARQVENRTERVGQWVSEVNHNSEMLQALVVELQQLVEVRGGTFGPAGAGLGDALDALELDRYNELHTVTQRLVERVADTRATGNATSADLGELARHLSDQDRIHLDLQNGLLETLAVPVGGLLPRFTRVVRQAARSLGKNVELLTAGEETRVDSDVLTQLAEPLAHLLRNAVDHGIESADERLAAGKDAAGKIRLSFARVADQVVISCRDDGRGLDLEAIKRRAVAAGMLGPDEDASEDELSRLIFRPGFTTKTVASQISGRGLGMDIVQASISRLKGSLRIVSEPGQGCEIALRLPVSQVVANVILVKIAGGWQAISIASVERLLTVGSEAFLDNGLETHALIDGVAKSAVFLEGSYGGQRPELKWPLPGLLMRGGHKVVIVERFGDAKSVIVKPLGPNVPALSGVLGATILGDGTVAPVIDLVELLESVGAAVDFGRAAEPLEVARLPAALVVDDSLSMRRSLEQLLIDWGFEVRVARDGLEAVSQIQERPPDVLLVDLEMPRMNGLELTSFVRNNDATKATPVIMITSRSTSKHRALAAEAGVDLLMTKPFSQIELFEAIEKRLGAQAG
jgi:chemotaxis protein histidine kinase CheA/ActR/RegA family two-component response regulator